MELLNNTTGYHTLELFFILGPAKLYLVSCFMACNYTISRKTGRKRVRFCEHGQRENIWAIDEASN
jgi:hypothetical protein